MRKSTRIGAGMLAAVAALAGCGQTGGSDAAAAVTGTQAQALASRLSPDAARERLERLPVKGRAPKTGYSRDEFGPAWTDDVDVAGGHNGCDTRNDILKRDLTGETFKDGSRCVVATGTLHDPYSGRTIHFVRGQGTSTKVQIDHVVALSDAWQKGAQNLSEEKRRELANDPGNLLAVDGPLNGQKSDADAATWLPPAKGYRCQYVARQIAVKAKYKLWVTSGEKAAMRRVLAGC